MAESATRVPAGLGETFAALRSPNYRLWFWGQLVSLVGTWMQTTAQGYLVYQLTHSPAYLGYVGFAAGIPSWLLMPYGGLVADRMSRRTLLIATQTGMMLLAFLLAALVASGQVTPWQIVAIAFGLGIFTAFDAPARQAFVVELVDREDLTNAIALNATMFNAAVVVGPAVAAAVYAAFGPTWCFVVNGLSFIAVIVALAAMRRLPDVTAPAHAPAISQLREGFAYVKANPLARTVIFNLAMISLFGISLLTLLPDWSVTVLGGDVTTNGLLLSARGLGAVAGALMIAYLGRRAARGRWWTIGGWVLPVSLVGFALVHWLPLAALAMVAMGWSFMVQANLSNSMVQTTLPDALRGRVMALYTLVFFGGMPVGSLLAGAAAEHIGAPATVLACAVILVAVAAGIAWRAPFLRRMW